jgi:hypothetical protein
MAEDVLQTLPSETLNPSSFFPLLGLLKPVTDITKQNPFIVSDAFPHLFLQAVREYEG